MSLVTTIIPSYNAREFISETIESAICQTHHDQEIIVVDDGSSDGSVDRLKDFGDRIHLIQQPNGGPAKARNTGARLASGRWLAFLDADDRWSPEKLEKQLALADEHTSLVYTDRLNFGDCGRMNRRLSEVATLWEGDVFEQLLRGNFITMSSALIRREDFLELGGFDEDRELISVEDWEFFVRFAEAGKRVRVCPEPLTEYRWHPVKISLNHDRCRHQRWTVLQRALRLNRAKELSWQSVRQAKANVWQASAWYASEASRWKAVSWYGRSLCYWPWDMTVYKAILRCSLGRV